MSTSDPVVVEVLRGEAIESTHLVDIAVVDSDGWLVASAGEASTLAAFRSAAKPLQASVSCELGWAPLDPRHLAIACGSHNAEPVHVGTVRRVLSSAGLTEDALACPPAWPFQPEDIAQAGEARRVQHNCSGKHAGFLATCVAGGLPLATYLDRDHPLQRAIAVRVEAAAGEPVRAVLVDGCGAPTFVLPLAGLARAFGSVHATEQASAMLAHPELIAGRRRLDTDVLAAGVVTKAGAEGLSCAVGVTPDGDIRALAVKARDGSVRGRTPAFVAALESLGLIEPGTIPPEVANPQTLGGGAPVGEARVRGSLQLR